MSNRFRIALTFALLVALIASISVSAKGGFAFITITGANLKEIIRAADGELTHDFFAFADFSQSKSGAPAEPGPGYEITRYYIDNNHEVVFDKLHYYPDTGFVFYDGIVNGSSEYDGKWYTAKTEIKPVFENKLSDSALTVPSAVKPVDQTQTDQSIQQPQSGKSMTVPPSAMPVVATASLAAIVLTFFLSRRKHAIQ